MAALIALAAVGLFAAGATVGIIGVVCMAIRQEDRNLTRLAVRGEYLVRHETAVAKGPEHVIERSELRGVRVPDQYPLP